MERGTKVTAGDISFYFWSAILIIVSYVMTIDGLSDIKAGSDNTQTIWQFVKEAFIFITPCGLDALVLLTSPRSKPHLNDTVEVVITMLSLGVSAYLFIVMMLQKGIMPLWIIQILLLGYPIRYVTNLAFSVYEAFLCRGNIEK